MMLSGCGGFARSVAPRWAAWRRRDGIAASALPFSGASADGVFRRHVHGDAVERKVAPLRLCIRRADWPRTPARRLRGGVAGLLDLGLIVEHRLRRAPASTAIPALRAARRWGGSSSALTKPRGSDAALTKSPDAPPRAPSPKRLSATRAACESRAIGFPLESSLSVYCVGEYTAVRYEPGIKNAAGFGSIDDKSVRKSDLRAASPVPDAARNSAAACPGRAGAPRKPSACRCRADGGDCLCPRLPAQAGGTDTGAAT